MATFGVVGTSPFADFQFDLEDTIYKYVGDNWSITTPSHLTKAALFLTTDPAQMENRPDPGNKPVWIWVKHFGLDTGRELVGSTIGQLGHIPHYHTFYIHLMTTRLTYGMLSPDMGIMSRELERIFYLYDPFTIPGIDHFDHFAQDEMVEAVAVPGFEAYAGMYLARCRITAHYYKQRLP